MAHHDELLRAARRLLGARAGLPGRLTTASIRRSISTSYYALFHFLSRECGTHLIGAGNELQARRRLFARTITHSALRLTFKKVRGLTVADDVREFLRDAGEPGSPVAVPQFLDVMANTFLYVQDLRHQADYDLAARFTAIDAEQVVEDVLAAIGTWRRALEPADRRLKKAICLLVTLRGRLRGDDL